MTKTVRRAVSCAAVLVAVALVFALAFTVLEAHHDCSGEDCPVCAALFFCRKLLSAVAVPAAAVLSVRLPEAETARLARRAFLPASPVRLKVELLN